MRGKPRVVAAPGPVAGFIPAHAGKTREPFNRGSLALVHPRACGENDDMAKGPAILVGSSPRMRGKPRRNWQGDCLRRFIPAHAGKTPRWAQKKAGLRFIPAHAEKTPSAAAPRRGSRVHPRACGENAVIPGRVWVERGSSPRMRGKPQRRRGRHQGHRFIPAHAGKTFRRRGASVPSWVHPRACGENVVEAAATLVVAGSSPRMRGKHVVPDVRVV